jgi:hypothetical protein
MGSTCCREFESPYTIQPIQRASGANTQSNPWAGGFATTKEGVFVSTRPANPSSRTSAFASTADSTQVEGQVERVGNRGFGNRTSEQNPSEDEGHFILGGFIMSHD